MNKKILVINIIAIIASLATAAIVYTMSTGGFDPYERQIQLGNKYLSELDYEQAIVAFEKAIEIDPKQVRAYVGAGKAYIATEQYDKAEDRLVTAHGISTDTDVEIINLLCEAYEPQEKYDEMIELIEDEVDYTSDNIALMVRLANGYKKTDRIDKLKDLLDIIAGWDIPFDPERYEELAELYDFAEDYEKSLEMWEAVDKYDSSDYSQQMRDELVEIVESEDSFGLERTKRLLSDYSNANAVHVKGELVYSSGELSGGPLEFWITDDRIRIDYYVDGKLHRTLLTSENDNADWYIYADRKSSDAGAIGGWYINHFKPEVSGFENASVTENRDGLLFDFGDTGRFSDNHAGTAQVKYCVSNNRIKYISSDDGSSSSKIVFHEIEISREISESVFAKPF